MAEVVPLSNSLVAGAVAGVGTRFVIAPLDVLKVRLQLQFEPVKVRFGWNDPRNCLIPKNLGHYVYNGGQHLGMGMTSSQASFLSPCFTVSASASTPSTG